MTARLFRCVVAGVAPLFRDSRSDHIRRDSFACSFLFRPRPTHHAAARSTARAARPARPRRDLPGVDARPPRGVTVFADRWGESDAARPQKRRRHFPPSHRLWVRSPVHVRFPRPCAVTSLAAGVGIVYGRLSRASAAPAPPRDRPAASPKRLGVLHLREAVGV
jgi:hypothetical protein